MASRPNTNHEDTEHMEGSLSSSVFSLIPWLVRKNDTIY